jgi:hypothetical protein
MEYRGLDNTQRWMRIIRHVVESEQKFADPSHYKSSPWMKFYANSKFWKYHIGIGWPISFLQVHWKIILKIILVCFYGSYVMFFSFVDMGVVLFSLRSWWCSFALAYPD